MWQDDLVAVVRVVGVQMSCERLVLVVAAL